MNTLFLQSDVKDPFSIYAEMLEHEPVYFDRPNGVVAIYSFAGCHTVLNSSSAIIPSWKGAPNEHEHAGIIRNYLARLSDGPQHTSARQAAMTLMHQWKSVDTSSLVHYLMGEPKRPTTLEWVNDIAKKLPALALLKGFDFSPAVINTIIAALPDLVYIMSPTKTEEQNDRMNDSVQQVLPLVNAFVMQRFGLRAERDIDLYAANLIGLLIQSYDAGRGMISNALLQLLKHNLHGNTGQDYFRQLVKETLRFDPPVHNTRRVLAHDLCVDGHALDAGENMLLVIAAANRDSRVFHHPDRFVLQRKDPEPYLSYGTGAHQCVAGHFSIHLTASLLHYFHHKFHRLHLLENEVCYEPKVNVRLPVSMHIEIA
jgi:cytochrome P450